MTIDAGTGDGRAVLAAAAGEPATLVLGLDANAAGMAEASRRAARSGRRGGLPNAAFVLAAAESPGDFIVAFVTSGAPARFSKFGVPITPSDPGWPQARLKAPSVIRTDRLCTLNGKVISGRIGVLSVELMAAVREQLKRLFSL